jgi:zinc transport system substrate-binding protein
MRKSGFRITLLALMLIGIAACSSEPAGEVPAEPVASEPERLSVYTVNYPLTYFAERIGGDAADVTFPVPSNVGPGNWSPGPDVIAAYQAADLILLNGAGYAGWVGNATLPQAKLVDTTAAVNDQLITVENAVTHSHGPGGEHSHAATASTTWLDPDIALAQARAVLEAMVRARPGEEAGFRERFSGLEADLVALGQSLEAVAALLGDRPVLFSHPVYQYLERRYELNGFSMHWEPYEMPTDSEWNGLRSVLNDHPATLMIWEGEPQPEIRERLAELGVESVVFAPTGNRPAEGGWLDAMQAGAEALGSR